MAKRAVARLPCVFFFTFCVCVFFVCFFVGGGGHNQARGQGGLTRPLVGSGQSPGRGFRRRSPRRKTIFSVLEWLGRLSLALFVK